MPTYDVTLNIAGIGSLSVGDQLDSMTISSGSSDGFDLATPSQFQAQFLIDATDQTSNFWLGRAIQVQIKPSDTATVSDVFFGWVDVVSMDGLDPSGDYAILNLQASGSMSRLDSFLVGGSGGFFWGSASERNRVQFGVGSEVFETSWQNFPEAVSWQEIDNLITWNNVSQLVAPVNVYYEPNVAPFGFGLNAYSSGAVGALSYLQELASGTQAILWESTTEARVNYTSFAHWSTVAADSLDVSTCVLADSLAASADMSNIYNVINYTNASTTITKTDINSIADYSSRSVTVDTEVSASGDLATLASNRVVSLSQPKVTLSSATVDLDVLPAATRALMYSTGSPQFWDLTNVPEIFGGNQTYFQCGTTLSLNYRHAEVELVMQPDSMRRGLTLWNQVSFANLWNNYLTPTTTWNDVN